jgi:hypothetical protein
MGPAAAGPLSDALGVQLWFIIDGLSMVVLTLVSFIIPAIMMTEENANEKSGRDPPDARSSTRGRFELLGRLLPLTTAALSFGDTPI